MSRYELKILLKSPALVGSGTGFGATIDSDVVFDRLGIPFIPGKRIKGCLRDAAVEVADMLELAGKKDATARLTASIAAVFGRIGTRQPARVLFPDLRISEYQKNRQWLKFFCQDEKFAPFVNPEKILNTFTELRQQTRIDHQGVAQDHSLRTIRVLRPGLSFSGAIEPNGTGEEDFQILGLACLNLRRFGSNRTRGYGAIACPLKNGNTTLDSVDSLLEKLCMP
jgi:CRISPR-associated protein Csx10